MTCLLPAVVSPVPGCVWAVHLWLISSHPGPEQPQPGEHSPNLQPPREPESWHRAPAVVESFTQHTLPATDAHLSSLFFCWGLRDVIESCCVLLSCPEVEKVTISKRGDKSNFSEGKIVIYRVVWGTAMLQALSAITVTAALPSSLPPAQPQTAALLKHLEGGGGNSQPRSQLLCGCWWIWAVKWAKTNWGSICKIH